MEIDGIIKPRAYSDNFFEPLARVTGYKMINKYLAKQWLEIMYVSNDCELLVVRISTIK